MWATKTCTVFANKTATFNASTNFEFIARKYLTIA